MTAAREAWDRDLDERASPAPLLQTWGWGEVQSHAGWTVERYQIDLLSAAERGRQEMTNELRRLCAQQVPGDTQRNLVVDATFHDQTFKHILAPVWLMTYVYGAKSYQVVVNGVTGTIAGSRPYSWIKVTLLVIALLIVFLIYAYNS